MLGQHAATECVPLAKGGGINACRFRRKVETTYPAKK